jgi:hypothetical protein
VTTSVFWIMKAEQAHSHERGDRSGAEPTPLSSLRIAGVSGRALFDHWIFLLSSAGAARAAPRNQRPLGELGFRAGCPVVGGLCRTTLPAPEPKHPFTSQFSSDTGSPATPFAVPSDPTRVIPAAHHRFITFG